LGFEAGQKIFNPITGGIPDERYVDRPFAGYLYAGSTLNLLYNNESNLKLGAQAGIIGPAALGEEAQTVIHDTFGFYKLNGWQYQIRNNFQLNLSAQYNSLVTRAKSIDLSLNTYANLGTGFTGAGAGVMMRLGNFNQLFNSVATQSTAMQKNSSYTPLHDHEIYFYYKPMINFVAYDATIQGGLFADDDNKGNEITVPKKPVILSNQLGVAYGGTRWVFDFAAIFRSKDVKDMMKSTHQWGSVTVLYRFN
jgi:lipid A 3-O-deacylase